MHCDQPLHRFLCPFLSEIGEQQRIKDSWQQQQDQLQQDADHFREEEERKILAFQQLQHDRPNDVFITGKFVHVLKLNKFEMTDYPKRIPFITDNYYWRASIFLSLFCLTKNPYFCLKKMQSNAFITRSSVGFVRFYRFGFFVPSFVHSVPIEQIPQQPIAVGIAPTQPNPIAPVPVDVQQPIEVATDPQIISNENAADNSAGTGELNRPIVTGKIELFWSSPIESL